MKKVALIIFSVSMFQWVSAQYCGFSDSSVCVATGGIDHPGLYPPVDSFPPLLNNFLTSATIQFRNFDTILFGNQVLPVYYLRWDTIENLPPGLCWSTNKQSNTYLPGEAGCIHFSGLACGPTGQYKLSTLVTVDIGIPVETDGASGGLGYFVRLENAGGADVPVDTTQTDSMPFIPYGGTCQTLTPPVVTLGPDQTVCAGSIVTFSPVVTAGQPPYTYLWQSVGSSIVCSTCPNASAEVTLNSTYVLIVTDASGGHGSDTINIAVTGTAYNFHIAAPEPITFCGGGTVNIIGNANDSVSFQWYNNGISITGATGNTLTVTDSSGAYYLVYTEPGVCMATSNIINLLFYDTSLITITSLHSDTFCVGETVTLVASATGSGLSYSWLANDSNLNYSSAAFVTAAGGIYQVAVTNSAGCTDTSAAQLVVASPNFPTPLSYIQFTNDTLCNNASEITLSGGQPAGGYYTGNGVTNSMFNPSLARLGLNFIYYNYTDSTGCGNSVYDTVVVLLCTDIQKQDLADAIKLYPNPAFNQLTIQSDLLIQGNVRVSVYDVTGKNNSVSYQPKAKDEISVNISTLSAGCYWLQIHINDRQWGRRFIKTD